MVGTNRAPPFPFISEQKATKKTKVSQHFDRCSIGWVRLTICRLHPLWNKADELSRTLIGAAIEVHRIKGPGLIESIYERCLLRELELRSIAAKTQKIIRIEYKG